MSGTVLAVRVSPVRFGRREPHLGMVRLGKQLGHLDLGLDLGLWPHQEVLSIARTHPVPTLRAGTTGCALVPACCHRCHLQSLWLKG